MPGFRVILFSSLQPFQTYRLLDRLAREVSGIEIAGLLCEVCPPKPLSARIRHVLRNILEPGFPACVVHRLLALFGSRARAAAHVLLRFAQASSVQPPSQGPGSPGELAKLSRQRGWKLFVTSDFHSMESLNFARAVNADLGVAAGMPILKPALYEIPRLGSVNIYNHKLPEYRGGGPAGLWELLDGQSEVVITIHTLQEEAGTGDILRQQAIRIDPYDNLTSLWLKAGILGEDLLVDTLRDFVHGAVQPQPQIGAGKTFRSPEAHELLLYQKKLAAVRQAYKAPRLRPAWKLLLRSSAYLWLLPFRNWKRRANRKFPLVILFHHLISDRPHPMALSTAGFLRHVRYLKRHYRLVSLVEGLRLLASGRIEEPTAVLTFDDGYEDNFANLRAVLRQEPVPVTMFVCPELSEKRQAFPHDVRDSREGFAPLTPEQIRKLAAEGMEIGSHTRTHFDCRSTDAARLQGEIAGSRRDLETLLGRPVTMFSFPWGKPVNLSAPALEIAEANYTHYFSAYGGANSPGAPGRHLVRTGYALDLWELELALQQLLDFQPTGYRQAAMIPIGNGSAVPVSTGDESAGRVGAAGPSR